ncbi:aminoglycoside phosphotransferase family protein [Blastococcus sp. CT_GayMR19]|uniref:phosphotransferase n=1 Tax=Blastococcus sp. CT_GayMR19 TaxID=2559608 RepID=UPI0010743692|nr:phosphotransferase [Blastococcus sp. CT_GayMR19]TFV75539.1 aminoglycoside phosphotransferase family protein [Blastococcus sp. CT_GayMR19]
MRSEESPTAGVGTWTDPAWRAAALDWAGAELEHAGLTLDGEPAQPHVYPWSTAFRLPVRGGAVWLKAVGPGSAHEPALSVALGGWVPDRVLVPLAIDAGRRLILLPDGGRTLRDVGGATLAEAWESMLRAYARLQLELVPHAAEMLALGVPDSRPDRLPALVGDLLADDDAQLAGREGGLAPRIRERVVADLTRYAELCGQLADGGIPATLQHDDLHDANVFVSRNRHRFFDWGDASVSHPFLSLLVTLRMARQALAVPPGHPVLFRLRDSYLDVWRDHGSPQQLREQCDRALQVGPLQRALTWRRILQGVHADEVGEWADAVPGWTAEHLAPGTLSAAPGRG